MNGNSRGRRAKWFRVAFVISATIVVHALGTGSAQAATVHAGPKTLAGFTSQHFPVFFKVSSDGKAVLAEGIGISLTCVSGTTLGFPDSFGRLPIHADGKLHASYASPTILSNGTAYSTKDTLTASFNSTHSQLSGTWQLSVTYNFSDGTGDQCDSGPVHFSATA